MHRHGGVRACWRRMRAGPAAFARGGQGCDAMRTTICSFEMAGPSPAMTIL